MEKEKALSESNPSVPPSLINSRQYVPWGMLFFRMISFAIFQSIIAWGFLLKNISNPWEQSLAWWPFSVSLTNFLCIGFLIRNARKENRKFIDQFRFHRDTLKKDLVTMIGVLFISIILVMGPNIGLAIALFNDPQAGLKLMDYPLPIWAVILSFLLLPTTQLFAEIPMYFTFIRPKLQQQGVKPWIAITLAALFLSLQHLAMPLILNPVVILYKMSMFLFFALFLGILLYRRPRFLPYIVIMHALFDAQLLLTSVLYHP